MEETTLAGTLAGRVALVAGGTRGAGRGIAVQLGAAGATVYVTGRTSGAGGRRWTGPRRSRRPPRWSTRPAVAASRSGSTTSCPTRSRRSSPASTPSRARCTSWSTTSGAPPTMEWDKTVWESDLDYGLRTLRLGVDTHAITSHFALPLLIQQPGGLVVEVTDGTDEYNADQLPGLVLLRPGQGGREPHGVRARPRAGPQAAPRPCRSRRAGCGPRRCSRPTA